MKPEMKLILGLMQIENLSTLLENNEYEQFFSSHLMPMKCEIQRQLSLFEKTNETN
jgi:hypothetical protein